MNQAVEFATRATPHANRWVQAAQDVMTGFMSTSRLLVTFVGCATLLMGAFVASNETARARISAQMPALLAGWIAPIGAVADSGTAAQEGPGDVRAAPVSDSLRRRTSHAICRAAIGLPTRPFASW